jgi:putative membrane protein
VGEEGRGDEGYNPPAMLTVQDLPALNATLNAISAVLLVTGYVLIRTRRPIAHRNVMIAALVSSILFLTSYLVYHAQVGSKHFPGTGTVRTVYLVILATHTVLAAAVPFLAGITVWRAWRRSFARHKRIARWTLPIWLYVSVTGVVVYWMLYRMTW